MSINNVTIVIPVLNQLHYTKQCLESLNQSGVTDAQIIIVNNGSTDGTAEFLAARPQLGIIQNAKNLGCGPAWTQGAQASKTTWTVVMNNDVLIPKGFIEGLVDFAEEERFDVVSPAMCEGELDYDLPARAAELMGQMANTYRRGAAHGVCFMVHRRVFDKIGYFNDYGGYEDDDFFRRSRRAGFRLAMTGRAYLHHFGSITQKSMKSWSENHQAEIRRKHYRKSTHQTWFKRKLSQPADKLRNAGWRYCEGRRHGRTLWETRQNGKSRYR